MFILEGFWLWGAIALFSVCSLILIENDRPVLSTSVLFVTTILLEFFTNFHPISLSINNPGNALLYILGYLTIGTLYGIVKWFSFVYMIRERAAKEIENYKKAYGEKEFLNKDETTRIGMVSTGIGHSLPIKASNYKATMMMWMCYWPISAPWTVLNDPLRRAWNYAYNVISGSLQKISDNVMRDVMKDLTDK